MSLDDNGLINYVAAIVNHHQLIPREIKSRDIPSLVLTEEALRPILLIPFSVRGPQTSMHGFDRLTRAFYREWVLISEHLFCSVNGGPQLKCLPFLVGDPGDPAVLPKLCFHSVSDLSTTCPHLTVPWPFPLQPSEALGSWLNAKWGYYFHTSQPALLP